MSKCRNCNVIIRDETELCPLCKSVLEQTGERENKYPDIWLFNHRLQLLTRIYLFVAIITEGVLIYLNYAFYQGIWWCAIVGCILAYVYLTLAYTVNDSKSGYRVKIIVAVAGAVLVLMVIDKVTGYRAWSANYGIPSGIMALDLAILLLIFINRRNWQSYLPYQIVMIVCSCIPFLLELPGAVTNPKMAYLALGISIACFLGTFIIGGRRAATELKRRFHI